MLIAKLYVLNDNEPSEKYMNEWGWSIYIEYSERRILFDADTEPRVIEYNSEELGLELDRLDFGFLSHHHRDHSGGYRYIAEIKPGLTIYVPPGDTSYLERLGLKPLTIHDSKELSTGIWSTGSFKYRGIWEHSMVIDLGKYSLLIVGCSHPGIDLLAETAYKLLNKKILYVVGGFHEPPFNALDKVASLAKYISPAHCSGVSAKKYVSQKYPDKYVDVRTGTVILVYSDRVEVEHY